MLLSAWWWLHWRTHRNAFTSTIDMTSTSRPFIRPWWWMGGCAANQSLFCSRLFVLFPALCSGDAAWRFLQCRGRDRWSERVGYIQRTGAVLLPVVIRSSARSWRQPKTTIRLPCHAAPPPSSHHIFAPPCTLERLLSRNWTGWSPWCCVGVRQA